MYEPSNENALDLTNKSTVFRQTQPGFSHKEDASGASISFVGKRSVATTRIASTLTRFEGSNFALPLLAARLENGLNLRAGRRWAPTGVPVFSFFLSKSAQTSSRNMMHVEKANERRKYKGTGKQEHWVVMIANGVERTQLTFFRST